MEDKDMCTIIFVILGIVFAAASLFVYICVGFMMLFFERTIKKDAYDNTYITVYENLLFKKTSSMSYKEGVWLRDTEEFKNYENILQNIVVSVWLVFAVAEVINHYKQVGSKL